MYLIATQGTTRVSRCLSLSCIVCQGESDGAKLCANCCDADEDKHDEAQAEKDRLANSCTCCGVYITDWKHPWGPRCDYCRAYCIPNRHSGAV